MPNTDGKIIAQEDKIDRIFRTIEKSSWYWIKKLWHNVFHSQVSDVKNNEREKRRDIKTENDM